MEQISLNFLLFPAQISAVFLFIPNIFFLTKSGARCVTKLAITGSTVPTLLFSVAIRMRGVGSMIFPASVMGVSENAPGLSESG